MNFIDWATFIAYIAFNLDMLFEIKKVVDKKDSADISLPGIFIRLAASTILVIKFIYIDEKYLIFGQAFFTIMICAYFILLMRYRKK